MTFKHIVDHDRSIVVLKATGRVVIMDIISELKKAISTRRGEGIKRRLVDMSKSEFLYTSEDAKKVAKLMKVHVKVFGTEKIAVLLEQIPGNDQFEEIRSVLNSTGLKFQFFSDRAKAAEFLNGTTNK